MKVWKDLFSGDEMVSDSYPHSLDFEDVALVVKSRLLTKKGNDNYGIDNSKLFKISLLE
jgi:hypothetical protein